MLSIGELSKRTGVKIPTIRYYEQMGLIDAPERSEGNQRRYTKNGLERLSFIKHARELGFSLEAISSLIELQNHNDRSCRQANKIAEQQLSDVTTKIRKLRLLQKELRRITDGCEENRTTDKCYVLASLADHRFCASDH